MDRIDHLSASAISCFLNNQVDFYKKYVAGVWDEPTNPSYLCGNAIHKAIDAFYSGKTMDEATRIGLDFINNTSDYEIDFGKTGSREKIISQYSATINKYWDECDQQLDVVGSEKTLRATIADVPMKCKIDLIYRDSRGLIVRDHKTVYSYSDPETENYPYILQGNIYLRVVEKELGEKVKYVEFDEIKRAANRDGSPQIRRALYTRQQLLDASSLYDRIITNIFEYVNGDNSIFFPNIRDRFAGLESMRIVSEQEESFKKARVRHVTVAQEKFAPRNVTTDIMDSSGDDGDNIIKKLAEFGIGGMITGRIEGCATTTYTLAPNRGVKMSKIATMGDDLALALGSHAVRVIAPIYGTNVVGIEVPTTEQKFPTAPKTSGLVFPVGQDTYGNDITDDLSKLPHMLVGGQTGSGKSVFLKNIINSVRDCDIDVVDMKGLDFRDCKVNLYTEINEALALINRIVEEMSQRYKNPRDGYVHKLLIIDEYADLVMQTGAEERKRLVLQNGKGRVEAYKVDTRKELERDLCRLLQKGRAAGISVIISTQRPSADIVAPIIKANCPAKACLRVATSKNSEIILDDTGGEALIGKGDMLYLGSGMVRPIRVQCYAPIEIKN